MNYLQDIYLYATKDVELACRIITPGEHQEVFITELLVFNPSFDRSRIMSPLTLDPSTFTSPAKAFHALINQCVEYANTHRVSILKINNPCNTAIISPTQQQTIVDMFGLSLRVCVNGAKAA